MDPITKVKGLIEDLGKDWKAYRETNDARVDALEKGEGVAEVEEKLATIDQEITEAISAKERIEREMKLAAERIDEMEATIELLGTADGKAAFRKDLKEYEDVFDQWMRSSIKYGGAQADPTLTRKLDQLASEIPEYKEWNTTVGASGGVAVPEAIARAIGDQVRLVSPIRDLVRSFPVGTPDYKELLNIHGENSNWVGEGAARSETNTSALRERAPTFGTLYAYPKATEESMDDMFFDVQNMIVTTTGDEFAIQEETAFLTGNGTTRPTGVFDTAPTNETDTASPPRSAEAFEYIPLDTSSPADNTIDADPLIDMVYKLRAPYRMRARWAMNSLTTGAIRKIKDNDGQYLWAPGLQPGEPARLLGYAHTTLEGMADVASNSLSVMFGDFKRGYILPLRVGVRITVDNNITEPGYVKWYIRERVGGIIFDNNAVKVGKVATS